MLDLSSFATGSFDRGASRLKEALWLAVRVLVFDHGVPLPSALKRFWLRVFGTEVGNGVVIRSRVSISFPWRLTLGDNVWIGDGVSILSLAQVEIGSNVCVSQQCFLCTGSHDYRKPTFDLKVAPIRIGDGCWLAARCFIAPGVTLGPGSVAAAGSIVVTDVAEHTVVGGNPAVPLNKKAEAD